MKRNIRYKSREFVPLVNKLLLFTTLLTLLFLTGGAQHYRVHASVTRPADLSEQLDRLAADHDFELDVRTDLSKAPPKPVSGDLLNRLDTLLADYNHVIIRSVHSGVQKVIVLGRKQRLPPAPDEIVLKMQRRGTHHLVQTTLVGANGEEIPFELLVDTGSTLVVLPRSLIAELGIAPDGLTSRQVRTAQGRVAASIGQLPLIRIEDEEIANVGVAFIDDRKLGNNALLGMSVLSRYKMTLDDENSTMTLIRNE